MKIDKYEADSITKIVLALVIIIVAIYSINEDSKKNKIDAQVKRQLDSALSDTTKQIVYVEKLVNDTIYKLKYKTKIVNDTIVKVVDIQQLDSNLYDIRTNGKWKLGSYETSTIFRKDSLSKASHKIIIRVDSLVFLTIIYKEDGLLKARLKCNNPNLSFNIAHNVIDKSVYENIIDIQQNKWFNNIYVGANIEFTNKYEVKPKLKIGYNQNGLDSYIFGGNRELGIGVNYNYYLFK
jgi:hypothetical protein